MKENNKKEKNSNNSKFDNNLQIELKNRRDIEEYGYDFVPRVYHWTDIDEQKINVDKIEEITDKMKKEK